MPMRRRITICAGAKEFADHNLPGVQERPWHDVYVEEPFIFVMVERPPAGAPLMHPVLQEPLSRHLTTIGTLQLLTMKSFKLLRLSNVTQALALTFSARLFFASIALRHRSRDSRLSCSLDFSCSKVSARAVGHLPILQEVNLSLALLGHLLQQSLQRWTG